MNKNIIAQKEKSVSELAKVISSSKSLLFFDYLGLTGAKITLLRKKLHKFNAKMYINKNNIFNRAVKAANISNFPDISGLSALIIANGDEIAPFKELYEITKESKTVKFKAGLLENNIVKESEFAATANLPDRNALYSMLLSCLQGNIRNLACGIQAVGEQKQQ
ncbi:MAG: 50S ribosomal protein L10 [Mycoplasmataceae bacterium]|jgi:large subunit ribosomal protein L10|nr:50S ribosomal protein L10 [Mycoplasmataceae bacterium]